MFLTWQLWKRVYRSGCVKNYVSYQKEPIILDLNLTALFTVAIKYYWPCKAEYTQAVTHSI